MFNFSFSQSCQHMLVILRKREHLRIILISAPGVLTRLRLFATEFLELFVGQDH